MLVRPSPGPISSAGAFGWRQLPGEGKTYHGGIDFVGALGSPVRAVKNGTVYVAAPNGTYNRYGNLVVVKHDDPTEAPYSLYAHLNSIAVRRGQRVVAGQRIGSMGNTSADRCDSGRTNCDPNHKVATHLHFELLRAFPAQPDVGRIDPTAYLSPGLRSPTGPERAPVYSSPSPTYAQGQGPLLFPAYSGPMAGLGNIRWTSTRPRPFATAPGAGLGADMPAVGGDPLSREPGMDIETQILLGIGLLPFAVAALRALGVLEAHP